MKRNKYINKIKNQENVDDFEIVSFKLKDGTEVKTNKDTHVMILKDRRIENRYGFKITYLFEDEDELQILSNKCNMLAHVFKYMKEERLTFEEGVIKYDNMIETRRKLMEDLNR